MSQIYDSTADNSEASHGGVSWHKGRFWREAPARSRTSQKMKAQFLISRALVVQFPLLLCPKESAVARFPKTHCLCWPLFVAKVSKSLKWLELTRFRTPQQRKAKVLHFLFSGKLLMCSFRCCFAKKHLRWPNFAQWISSAALNCRNELVKGVGPQCAGYHQRHQCSARTVHGRFMSPTTQRI